MNKKLISDDTLNAYKTRFEVMNREKDTEEGNRLFAFKMVAISEQIDNLHVKAKINNFEIENDGPKDLIGSSEIPGPMAMFLASIANCLEITALLYLSYGNLKVNSIKIKVEADYDKRSALNPNKEPFPGLSNLNLTWYLDTEEKLEKIKRILKKIEDLCPVKGTLTRTHIFKQKIELIN